MARAQNYRTACLRWLGALVLLVFMSTCDIAWLWECSTDDDCDDGNPCTSDWCDVSPDVNCDSESWCDDCASYYCRHWRREDGTSCQIDESPGVCKDGSCRLDDDEVDDGV